MKRSGLTAIFSLLIGLLCVFGEQTVKGEEASGHHKVLVGSILNNRTEFMSEFLTSLQQLHCSYGTVDYCFVTESDVSVAWELIKTLGVNGSARCCILDAHKEPSTAATVVWRIGEYKNRILEHARKNGYEYLFLIDSRIVLHPKTLDQLISTKKDIVANIFWTNLSGESAPQVWLSDLHNQFELGINEKISDEERAKRQKEFFSVLKTPGTYQVGGLGACTLISKAALDKGVSYEKLKNVSFFSEDAHFCLRAESLDIPLFVDTHYPAYCLLTDTGDSSLEGLSAYRAKMELP